MMSIALQPPLPGLAQCLILQMKAAIRQSVAEVRFVLHGKKHTACSKCGKDQVKQLLSLAGAVFRCQEQPQKLCDDRLAYT